MPEITRYDIELWVKTVATGDFHYKNVLGLDRILSPKEDNKLRGIIFELCKVGVCESIGRRDGFYRPVQNSIDPIDFTELRPRDFPVILPFELRKYVFMLTYPLLYI